MKDATDFLRQQVTEIPPYEPILPYHVLSEELGIPAKELIKLDANENPYGPIKTVSQAIGSLDTLHIYPDPESRRIRELLASYHQISKNQIVLGAGADELIDLIMRIFFEPGDRLINCPPTFGMYAFDGALNHAEVIDVPRNSDFSLDIEALENTVETMQPKMLFLANPNNPDGGMISEEEFERLVKLPLVLVLDEAYINFGGEDRSKIREVQESPHLFVLRSFSKWAGLAGIRIGYGVFPTEIVPTLMKTKQPYNVAVIAEEAAITSIQNVHELDINSALIIEGRLKLFNELRQIPWIQPYPSEANFILCKVNGITAVEVKEALRKKGILIRYFDKLGLRDHIRISVGTMNQIDSLINAMKGIG